MKAIFKREFKAFFTSPIGYIFIAANLFLIGIYFTAYNLQGSYPYFSYTVSSSVIIFFITIPLLTMRVLAEERRNKTDQLILTAPVSVGKIVLGKFLAVAAVLGIVILIICFYPLIMNLYGTVPMGETYTAILGFALYGLAGASVGIFISSLTESQIIAAVLSFAFMFVSYFMSGIESIISSTGNLFTKILSAFDFMTPFDTFLNGSLDLTAVIYYLSVVVLLLFLTTQSIQKRRYSVSVKNLAMGAYSTVAVVVSIAVCVFVNIVANQIPEKYTVFDTTSNNLYSLTDESKEVLKTLDEDVTIYIYCKEGSFDTTVEELLKRYQGESEHIKIEYVNPSLYPTFPQTYTSSSVSTGSLIIVSEDKNRVVAYSDLYETETSINYTTYSYETNTTGFDAEGQITSALAYVTGDEMPTVYSTIGHGELDLSDSLTDAIAKSNMDTAQVTILTEGEIPEDCEFLIINNPTGDFSADDCEILKAYLEKGGNLLVNMYASGTDMPNLWGLLSEYGFDVTNSLVMEGNKNYYYTYPLYLLPEIASDDITSSVYNSYYVFAPYTLGMTISDELPDNVEMTQLLYTSSSAYAKDATKEISTYEMEDDDAQGTFTVLAKAVVTNDDESVSNIVVNACGEMFTDSADQMVAGANTKLFNGILTSLSDLEVTISIPVKSMEVEYLSLSTAEIGLWRMVCLVLVPIALVVAGIVVFVRRRKK